MEQQADFVTTVVPTSIAPAVPSHGIKPFSNNHVQDPVYLGGDRKMIVCALAAPGNPFPDPFCAERKRQTFWTECASCKKKNKHSIEYRDCNVSCLQCSETFKATEVSRPRSQCTSTTENFYSGAIVTSPGTIVEPSKMTPTVETPLRKKVKREINETQAFGVQKTNKPKIVRGKARLEKPVRINIRKRISEAEIKAFLMSKGRYKVIEATIKVRSQHQVAVDEEHI